MTEREVFESAVLEREMFERSFQRPRNFFDLPPKQQWEIDKELGILDWVGEGLSEEDEKRFREHYEGPHFLQV